MSDETIYKIYKSRIHILEIMNENGYDTSKYENFNIKEIEAMMNQLDMILEHKTKKQKIYIQYSLNGIKINESIQDLYDTPDINNKILLNNSDILYIITQSNINFTLETELKYLWDNKSILVVVEKLDQLQFNIFKAKKVPKHILLTDEEQEEFLLKYNTLELPQIGRFDPVARALCARPGQIIKITRSSPNSIEADFYRICLNVNTFDNK